MAGEDILGLEKIGLGVPQKDGKAAEDGALCHRMFTPMVTQEESKIQGKPPRFGSMFFNAPCYKAKCQLWDDKRGMCADRSELEEKRELNTNLAALVKILVERKA